MNDDGKWLCEVAALINLVELNDRIIRWCVTYDAIITINCFQLSEFF